MRISVTRIPTKEVVILFIQIVEANGDTSTAREAWDAWERDVRPSVTGYLGTTGGVTDDGRLLFVARFESPEAAAKNNDLAEQQQWYEKHLANLDGLGFTNCSEVDELLGGGSDGAGFVQLIRGKCSDPQKMREMGQRLETELSQRRPDVLGGTVAWHDDDRNAFTQTMYFKSEEEARRNEADEAMGGAPEDFTSLLSDLSFIDLHEPWFA